MEIELPVKWPNWVEIDDEKSVIQFRAKFVGRHGGNVVVALPVGGQYIGLPENNLRWVIQDEVVQIPFMVAVWHRQLVGDEAFEIAKRIRRTRK